MSARAQRFLLQGSAGAHFWEVKKTTGLFCRTIRAAKGSTVVSSVELVGFAFVLKLLNSVGMDMFSNPLLRQDGKSIH